MATSRKKNNLKIHDAIDLADRKNPVPFTFGSTSHTTAGGNQYHAFFSPEDNAFQSFLEARLLSPTQGECIKDKVFYAVGNGLKVRDDEFPKDFDRRINGKRQTLDDILISIFNGYFQDGNKFIEIVRTEVQGKRYVHVYPHSSLDCRFEAKEDGSEPTHVIVSKSFRKNGIVIFDEEKKEKLNTIPLWSDDPGVECWKKDGDVERTMLHIKNEVDGIDYYGLPSNFAGLYNVVLEWKITGFNLDNFDNNMFLAGLLFISGNMTSTEEAKFLKKLKDMYTGEGKANRVLPISSEGGLHDTKFVPFTEKQDGHFTELDKRTESKIILANSWSRELMDLKDSSGLGRGGAYLKDLFLRKFRTVITPAQSIVLNNFIYPLMQIIDEYKGTKFYDMDWMIEPVIPISLEGQLDLNSLLTVDEGREEMGKPTIGGDKGSMLISEVGKNKNKDEDESQSAK